MSEPRCTDPLNALLPWYLNGTLEGEEHRSVREHVAACAACSQELDELSSFARSFRDAGAGVSGAPMPPPREAVSGRTWAWSGIAAAVALILILSFWLRIFGTPELQDPAGQATVASLDLGSGPARGAGAPPELHLPGRSGAVEILFVPPVEPAATYELEILGPHGRTLSRRPRRTLLFDAMGRSRLRVAVERLRESGDYRLLVRQFPQGGTAREYVYPFIVRRAPA